MSQIWSTWTAGGVEPWYEDVSIANARMTAPLARSAASPHASAATASAGTAVDVFGARQNENEKAVTAVAA
eukprot:CAMPEP_0119333180 /NCGR_PEP_ID=MMETSP1333-20130426/84565_1 /TAXON_ID=418940 /ORGANISM="Scyphosphaera apsteinii, Strain RCC1455" /LENGTH=70 /DNA_ID=CAMNT_0007343169 /DNA_START=80 /DNA_END=293 /DNA_ORIENTATION=-